MQSWTNSNKCVSYKRLKVQIINIVPKSIYIYSKVPTSIVPFNHDFKPNSIKKGNKEESHYWKRKQKQCRLNFQSMIQCYKDAVIIFTYINKLKHAATFSKRSGTTGSKLYLKWKELLENIYDQEEQWNQ